MFSSSRVESGPSFVPGLPHAVARSRQAERSERVASLQRQLQEVNGVLAEQQSSGGRERDALAAKATQSTEAVKQLEAERARPVNAPGITKGYSPPFLGTRPNISESHSEISTRVPFCIAAGWWTSCADRSRSTRSFRRR